MTCGDWPELVGLIYLQAAGTISLSGGGWQDGSGDGTGRVGERGQLVFLVVVGKVRHGFMPQSPLVRILLLLAVAVTAIVVAGTLFSGSELAAGDPVAGSPAPAADEAVDPVDSEAGADDTTRPELAAAPEETASDETATGPDDAAAPEDTTGGGTAAERTSTQEEAADESAARTPPPEDAATNETSELSAPDPTTALIEKLRPLIAEPSANIPDYDRDRFAGWRDADGDCVNTRHEVLQSEAAYFSMTPDGCAVASGEWLDSYTGRTYTNPGYLDVDHVVALADAWVSGARDWTDERLDRFSNDLGNLNAIAAGENRFKSDRGPADYSPSAPGALCGYLVQYATVKIAWQLSITHQDFEALASGLTGCTIDSVPNDQIARRVTPQPAPPAVISPEPTGECHPLYEPCLPNLPGDALNCDDLSPDQKPVTVIRPDPNSSYPRSLLDELNQKPVTVIHPDTDPYRLDRDGDGRGCTS